MEGPEETTSPTVEKPQNLYDLAPKVPIWEIHPLACLLKEKAHEKLTLLNKLLLRGDLERASVGRRTEPRAAADLKTLAASVQDQELRRMIETDLIDEYVAHRRTLSPSIDFRALLSRAQPTRTFHRQSRLAERPSASPQSAELYD